MEWLAIAVGGLGLTAPAGAAEVDWRGPDTCPDAAELRFSIERTIGMPLSRALPLRFEIQAERSPEGYVARMDVAGEPHAAPRRRVLVGSDCSQLADLVAVTAAIALGASDGASDAETRPGFAQTEAARSEVASLSLRTEAPPPGVADRPGVELTSASQPAPGWSPAFSLWFVGDAGSLARTGAGLALGAGLEHAQLQLRALATLLFDQRATLEAGRALEAGAELALAAAAFSACSAPFVLGSSWGLQGCAGWELGRLSGEGTGIVSRLMQEEGIYYHFKHVGSKHVLVLCDSIASHEAAPDLTQLPFYPPDRQRAEQVDHIDRLEVTSRVEAGVLSTGDFNFQQALAVASLRVTRTLPSRAQAQGGYEIFDYPGEYVEATEGDDRLRIRLEEQESLLERVIGHSNCRGIAAGCLLTIQKHPLDELNLEYLILSMTLHADNHDLESGGRGAAVSCDFSAMDSRRQFRSPRTAPKPVVQGAQTAIVVGPENEEIWTDEYGRVKCTGSA